MLASLKKDNRPFDDKEWVFEIKWDGYRAIAEVKDNLRLYSRNGINFGIKFSAIAEALLEQPHEMILDGEIVAYNDEGLPDFQLLQDIQGQAAVPLQYQVFDLLYLNGQSTEPLTLIERKELLKKALQENDYIQYCDHIEKNGTGFFKIAKEKNLEGIIAKNAAGSYVEGRRSNEWLKIKNILTEEAIITGFTKPKGSRNNFGALILGRYKDGILVYAGHTGTGFNTATLKELHQKMTPLITQKSPFKKIPVTNMPATWIKPELVCHIKYTELTKDHIFRHPVYTGLRVDKNAAEVIVPKNEIIMKKTNPSAKNKSVDEKNNSPKEIIKKIGARTLKLTNQDKIYWPEDGYTKGDVITYYEKMAPYILPYLKNRPESLHRFPHGITGESFYHKDAGDTAPPWVTRVSLFSESTDKNIDYIICNDAATLVYLANLGCIEMNPWNSTVQNPEKPSYMIMDIDPSAKNSFEEVVAVALTIKEILDHCGAASFCKTSGATGLHVFVPMGGKYDYEQVKNFAHLVAMQVVEKLPGITTLERNLKKRGNNKIYVDYLQNRKGQTIASVYSLRPKQGATISTPLQWNEVKKGIDSSAFNIKTIYKRVNKLGDIFKPVLGKGINLLDCLKKME